MFQNLKSSNSSSDCSALSTTASHGLQPARPPMCRPTQPTRVPVRSPATRLAQWRPIVSYRDSRHPFSTPSMLHKVVLPKPAPCSSAKPKQETVTNSVPNQEAINNESPPAPRQAPSDEPTSVWDLYDHQDSSPSFHPTSPPSTSPTPSQPLETDDDESVESFFSTDHSVCDDPSHDSLYDQHVCDWSWDVFNPQSAPSVAIQDITMITQVSTEVVGNVPEEWGALCDHPTASPRAFSASTCFPRAPSFEKSHEPKPWPHVYPHKIKATTRVIIDHIF